MYKTRKFLNLHVSIHRYFWISLCWNTKIKKFMCFIHWDFWISMYWNMEIQKYEQFCLQNLHVSIHGDFWISVDWNKEIQKSPCFRTRQLNLEERKQNLFRKNFNNMPLHTLIIDFLKKKFKNQTFFFESPCFIHGYFYFKGL